MLALRVRYQSSERKRALGDEWYAQVLKSFDTRGDGDGVCARLRQVARRVEQCRTAYESQMGYKRYVRALKVFDRNQMGESSAFFGSLPNQVRVVDERQARYVKKAIVRA
jgi:hypothetical protein